MFKLLAATIAILMASIHIAVAAQLPPPKGRVLLEVSGLIDASNAVDEQGQPVARFDLAALEDMPQTTLETTTEWTEGLQVFEGVRLRDLLDMLNAPGSQIRAIALNDYEATLPTSDADTFGVLLAIRQNGDLMRIRDKGPIWIIYPSSVGARHLSDPNSMKMVWQLNRLVIE